jgi:hypothetical protein
MADVTFTGRPVLSANRTACSPNLAGPGRFCNLNDWERN